MHARNLGGFKALYNTRLSSLDMTEIVSHQKKIYFGFL